MPPQHQSFQQPNHYRDNGYSGAHPDDPYANAKYYSNNNNGMNNGSMTSFNNFASNRNSTGSAFSLASDDFLRQQGPPPVPPPHSVPLKPLGASSASPSADFSRDSNGHGSNNNNSNRSSGVGINRSGTNSAIPRTPSPLRNAMDDVMYSLQTLELATSPGKDKHLAQFERSDSTASFRSPSIRESPAITAPAPLPPFSSRSAGRSPERDSGVMPFSSSSFGEPPFVAERRSPEREQTLPSSKATGVHRGGTRNSIIGSLSQKSVEDDKMRLNDSLILGDSSDDEYSSGDYGAKSTSKTSKNSISSDTRYSMSSLPGFSNSVAYEKPVDLPQNNMSGAKAIRKQFGVIKKFFANNIAANSVRMGTTMSAAPRHERANSAVVISNNVPEYRGRTALSSHDIYPNRTSSFADVFGENTSHEDQERWIEINRALHRTNTLTETEIEERIKRAHQQLGSALAQRVLEPVEALKQIAGNETGDGGYAKKDTLRLARYDFGEVDIEVFSASWDVFAQYRTMTDLVRGFFKRHWRDPIDQLRAAFNFCATKLKWEPLFDDDDDEDDDVRKSFTRIMQTRRASCLDVALFFQEICSALEIPCEVVPGYLKGPGEVWYDETPLKPNHYWNGVIVDGVWRMVDTSLANPSFPTHHLYAASISRQSASTTPGGAGSGGLGGLLSRTTRNSLPEHFYFLTKPSEFLFTHTPTFNNLDATHVIPNLGSDILLSLPLKAPVAFQHGVSLLNFNTALARIVDGRDYLAELLVKVRNPNVYLVARVKPGNFPIGSACSTSYHSFDDDDDDEVIGGSSGMAGARSDAGSGQNALAQPFWNRKHDRLFYRIKAVLPRAYRQGALNIYVGMKPQGSGAPPRRRAGSDDLVLALSVPLTSTPDDEIYGVNPRKFDRRSLTTGERESEMDRPVQFVQRYPLRCDIYIKQPQCFNLIYGHDYMFKVQYYDTLALSNESSSAGAISRSLSGGGGGIGGGGGSSHKIKMALQTPRGRVIKMARAQDLEDTWQLQHCVLDIGVWRALVLDFPANTNWSVYAEWYCMS